MKDNENTKTTAKATTPRKMGSWDLLTAIRDSRKFAGAPRTMLEQLALRSRRHGKDDNTWFCFPSYETLALDTALSIRTLKRAAQELEHTGVLRRHVRPNRPNLYYISFALLREWADLAKKKELAACEADAAALNYEWRHDSWRS